MENQSSAISLYQVIKNQTDEQTAYKGVSALQGAIKEEVKNETKTIITDTKFQLN